MVSTDYARGWDDCLEAVKKMLTVEMSKSGSLHNMFEKVEELHELIKGKKFEKIRDELGVFGLF